MKVVIGANKGDENVVQSLLPKFEYLACLNKDVCYLNNHLYDNLWDNHKFTKKNRHWY